VAGKTRGVLSQLQVLHPKERYTRVKTNDNSDEIEKRGTNRKGIGFAHDEKA